MSLTRANPILHNLDISKLYHRLLNTSYNNDCCYIDKYGRTCKNKCIDTSTFIIREYFCDNHIKKNIDDIIKINHLLYLFNHYDKYIQYEICETYTVLHKYNHNIMHKLNMNKMFRLLKDNRNYIVMTQPMIGIMHGLLFRYFQIGVYDMDLYKMNLGVIKTYKYKTIIQTNIQYKIDCMNCLIDLSNKNNNTIGIIFLNSNIADYNIFKIIESFI
uniref:Uncharacterized protein n=1 Tax=viral metagenome TaxID=1070528 RepID=A0A6C0I758_9ZZZZ